MHSRRALFFVLLALGLLRGTGQAQQPARTDAPTFPTQLDLVTVDVIVTDKNGNPVEGLTAADFALSEEGKPQTISSFDAVAVRESAPTKAPWTTRIASNGGPPPRPERSFSLVFDDAHLTASRIGVARKAVQDFLESVLRDGDQLTIAATSGGGWWSAQMPEGRAEIAGFLARFTGKKSYNPSAADSLSDYEAMRLQVNRDPAVLTEVSRRFFENGVIADPPPPPSRDTGRQELQISPGQLMIQTKAAQVYAEANGKNQATLRTLKRVVESLGSARGRKTVILVSEGFVYDPSLPELREVQRSARQANAVLYFVDPRGLSGGPSSHDAEVARSTDDRDLQLILSQEKQESEGSQSLAIDTGGFSVQNTNDLAKGFRRIADESRSHYLLGFSSTNTKHDGRFRKLSVDVQREGVSVRARKGYYAPSDEKTAPSKEKDALAPNVRRALDSPWGAEGIPLRLTSYVLGPSGAKSLTLLVADADPAGFAFEEKGGRSEAALESFAVITARDSGETFTTEKRIDLSLPHEVKERLGKSWLPILREFQLPPGVYQARLLVRDTRSGRVGSVRHEFEVEGTSKFRITTPILTDTLQAGDPSAQAAPRPVPLARRTFVTGTRLFCAYEVHGVAPTGVGEARVSAGYSIQSTSGMLGSQPLTPLRPALGGQVSQVIVLSLEGVAPGGYELVLSVRDDATNEAVQVREAFAVVAR